MVDSKQKNSLFDVPSIRFESFNEQWKETQLGKISRVFDGTHQTPTYTNKGVRFLSVENVTNKSLKSTKFVSREDYEVYKKRVNVEINDILMTRIGSIGVPMLVDWEEDSTFYVSLANIKLFNKEQAEFVYHFIQTTFFQKELWKRSLTTATPQKINLGEISKSLVRLPSVPEQQKIAGFFTLLDRRIGKQQEKVETWREYKKGIMQKLFSRELRFRDKDGQEFPEWEERYIGEIADVSTGNKDTQDKIEDGRYPFYVRSNTVEKIESYSFDGEAILTAGDGVGVGKVFHYVNGKFDFHQRVYKISNFQGCIGKFLYYYFTENFLREAMKYNAKTSVDSVRREMITKMLVPLPSLEEQKKIAKILSVIETKVEKEEMKFDCLTEQKKGLMQRMFI